MKRLNQKTFEALVSEHDIALVLFGAPDGEATMRQAVEFAEAWARHQDDAGFGYVDAFEDVALARTYAIRTLPTVLMMRRGEPVAQLPDDYSRHQISAALCEAMPPRLIAA